MENSQVYAMSPGHHERVQCYIDEGNRGCSRNQFSSVDLIDEAEEFCSETPSDGHFERLFVKYRIP